MARGENIKKKSKGMISHRFGNIEKNHEFLWSLAPMLKRKLFYATSV